MGIGLNLPFGTGYWGDNCGHGSFSPACAGRVGCRRAATVAVGPRSFRVGPAHELGILRPACVIADVIARLSAELSAAPSVLADPAVARELRLQSLALGRLLSALRLPSTYVKLRRARSIAAREVSTRCPVVRDAAMEGSRRAG